MTHDATTIAGLNPRPPRAGAVSVDVRRPCWNGAPWTYVTNCFTVRTASTSGAGAHAQPVFHPVIENVFPADEIVTVRSRIPGIVAIGMCSPSYTRCS